jgi:hypothetical protein
MEIRECRVKYHHNVLASLTIGGPIWRIRVVDEVGSEEVIDYSEIHCGIQDLLDPSAN